MAAYSEKEMFNIWSRMDQSDHKEMIRVMNQLFGLTKEKCEEYDSKFTKIRNRRIYECSHPYECSRVNVGS